MGYTTDFIGSITIDPPLNQEEIDFLQKFSSTRRMNRKQGPYYVGDTTQFGEDGVLDCNVPPAGQPGLWCHWIPTNDGKRIVWDEGEKFYHSSAWMQYLINHFLCNGCIGQESLPFLQANHVCTGLIRAQGEDSNDKWDLLVNDNVVNVIK